MSIADTSISTDCIQGIPALQPFYADDLMVSGIIICGLILAIILSDRKRFLPRLFKGFFLPRENGFEVMNTTSIAYMRMGMYVVTGASLGLLLAAYATKQVEATHGFLLPWLLATGCAVLFHLSRLLLFVLTDRIFFDKDTHTTWEHSYANWTILSGIPLYLLAVAVIFFNPAPSCIIGFLAACVVLLELCLVYKAFHIFSGKKYGILQIFMYLCALELIPLLMAGKALVFFI